MTFTTLIGIANQFKEHDFCSTDPWIQNPAGSAASQHDSNGAFHATLLGHIAGARATRKVLCDALSYKSDCTGDPC